MVYVIESSAAPRQGVTGLCGRHMVFSEAGL